MSEWYEIDAAWDADGYASGELLKLGETREWCDLMDEVARLTHATAEEAYDGMAKALRDYLESLDGQDVTGDIERVTDEGELLHDTREKLEEDVRAYMFPWRVDMALDWLDRQAAITEKECCKPLKARIAELEREIATLKEHRAGNMERLHELTDECAELRKYRDEWKGLAEKYRADSIAAQAETERYRGKLGDVLDAIHEAERAAR